MEEEIIEKKLNEIYTSFENDVPPTMLYNEYDQAFNEGLYKGRLKAMETVVRELTGKKGEEINNP